MSQSAATASILLVCVAGPDAGKRAAISSQPTVIGRSSECEVASDDPEVGSRHVTVHLEGGKPVFAVIQGCKAFLDGQAKEQGILESRQQLRIGRSLWQVEVSRNSGEFSNILGDLGDRISDVAGLERIEGFEPAEIFSQALRKRTDEEMEQYFAVGTPTTTPPLAEVETTWPKPWLFLKTFTLAALVYLGFLFAYQRFQNPLVIPGLLTIGAFVIPFSLLILFFEVNVARNVPLYQLLRLMFLGGILSVILSLFLFEWTKLSSWLGAMSAGLVEEAGKAAALLLVIRKVKYRWILNGMLFGAAIGAGFAAFESAGYAFLFGEYYGPRAMLQVITQRGIFSILGGHVLWTAIVGAALWRVRGDKAFEWEMLRDPRFLRAYGLAAIMHMVWNSPLNLPFSLKYIAVGFVAWTAVLGFIQAGLRQIRSEQTSQATTAVPPPVPPGIRV